jgi:hypothetical protein
MTSFVMLCHLLLPSGLLVFFLSRWISVPPSVVVLW